MGAATLLHAMRWLAVRRYFEHWPVPVRLFTRDAAAEYPVETDNQWGGGDYVTDGLSCAKMCAAAVAISRPDSTHESRGRATRGNRSASFRRRAIDS